MKTNIEGSSEPIEIKATERKLTIYEQEMRKRIKKLERRIDKRGCASLEAAS
jgi:hypothetical protein